ncbi:MAG TPA: hypothetical protein VNH20_00875 [Candidatus Dormibacteraeota bacterium]|nr:hypothetical protein [Candidatus Dormibacteraeota bacterium]
MDRPPNLHHHPVWCAPSCTPGGEANGATGRLGAGRRKWMCPEASAPIERSRAACAKDAGYHLIDRADPIATVGPTVRSAAQLEDFVLLERRHVHRLGASLCSRLRLPDKSVVV